MDGLRSVHIVQTASEVEVAGRIDTTRKSLRDQEDRLGDVDDRIVEVGHAVVHVLCIGVSQVKAALEALTIRRGKVDDEIGGGVLTEEIVEECGQIEERAQGVAGENFRTPRVASLLLHQPPSRILSTHARSSKCC